MSPKPSLSICIPSYNRVSELFRCLKSIDATNKESIEIVICEDCSPRREEITEIVEEFKSNTEYAVVYESNATNLGFDRNLNKLINVAKGEYLLFITDDDMFTGKAIDEVIDHLKRNDCAVAFTPYVDKKTGVIERKFYGSLALEKGINGVKRYLFNSILLSGLIFKKDKMPDYSADKFKDLIYSQVYLFSTLLLNYDGCYIDVPLVYCVGDGENAFGLNESSESNELLADRQSPLSNLEYHKSLIKLIRMFDVDNDVCLLEGFSKEYSIRSFTGMYIARKKGINELKAYWATMRLLNIKICAIAHVYYWFLFLFGYKACSLIFYIPKAVLLSARKIYSYLSGGLLRGLQ